MENNSGNQSLSVYQLKQPDRSADVPEGVDVWEGDKLGRKNEAERLANMIAGQIGPLTIGLNGPWGEGKTFFLKRFQKTYESKKGCAVYFNAWQDDFLDDPLLSLLFQLRKHIDGLPQETLAGSVKQAVLPVLKHAGLALFKSFVKNTAKIDIDALSLEDIETKSEKVFDGYAHAAASRDELVKALGTLAENVRKWSGKPLVVIVDELDRCRPTFAIETLERIKHLFNVENIVFVLGIDRVQLESSIHAVYGEIDAQGYLQRFIDVEFVLSRKPLKEFIRDRLVQSHISEAIDPYDGKHIASNFFSAFHTIADAEQLSLRAVEHAIRRFALVACAREPSESWTILAAYAVGLSLHPDKSLYQRFMNGECEPKEVIEALFPDFQLTYSTLNSEQARIIQYLYSVYYRLHWDERTKHEFDAMLKQASQKEGASVDMRHLPSCVASSSPEEVYHFFELIRYDRWPHVTLKIVLLELREAMSSIVEFGAGP